MNYQAEIEKIIEEEKKLAEHKAKLMAEWVESEHPLKIGDIVEAGGCHYLHIYQGLPFVVKKRFIKQGWRGGWVWGAIGNIINKDGTEGARIGHWDQEVERR